MDLRVALRTSRLALIVAVSAPPAHANQVTLVATKDNTLIENATGSLSNGAGRFFFAGRTGQLSGSIRRGVVGFDLAASIPPGSRIDSVAVVLHMSKSSTAGAQTVVMRRLLADWGEGTSVGAGGGGGEAGGAPSTLNDATWIHRFFDTQFWSSAGGDFAAVPSASASVGDTTFYTWSSWNLVTDVQGWVANPASNFGWIFTGNESAPASAKEFGSRQNLDPRFRPRLFVRFRTPVDSRLALPGAPGLRGAYPNPFNPNTTIAYEIPATQYVVLRIHDVAGRLVRTLVSRPELPGQHEVAWDGRDDAGFRVGSGTYYCQLSSGGRSDAKPLVLLK